ncbi:MAG TPA: hypothetical protein VG963_09520, partial [Polyangiaceae bacterium]|nr:hypothetical protein [Polyangiaceae bacterium]
MNELPPQAASVLEQARRADQPDEFDLERSLASLHAALPFADVARTARWDQSEPRWPDRGPSGPSTFAGAAFSGKAIKLLLVTVVLGGIGAGAVQMHGSSVQRAAFAVNAQSSAAPAAFRSAGEIEPGFLARHEPANPPGRATETEHHGAIDASTRRPQSPAHAVRSKRRQRTGRTRRASRFVAPVELDSAEQTSEMPATVAGAKPLASPSVDGRDQPPEAPPASAQAAKGELDLIDSA